MLNLKLRQLQTQTFDASGEHLFVLLLGELREEVNQDSLQCRMDGRQEECVHLVLHGACKKRTNAIEHPVGNIVNYLHNVLLRREGAERQWPSVHYPFNTLFGVSALCRLGVFALTRLLGVIFPLVFVGCRHLRDELKVKDLHKRLDLVLQLLLARGSSLLDELEKDSLDAIDEAVE